MPTAMSVAPRARAYSMRRATSFGCRSCRRSPIACDACMSGLATAVTLSYSRVAPVRAAARAARRSRRVRAQHRRAAGDPAGSGRRGAVGARRSGRRCSRGRRVAAADRRAAGRRAHARRGVGMARAVTVHAALELGRRMASEGAGGGRAGPVAARRGRLLRAADARICRSRSSTSRCSTRSIGSSATSR